MIGKSLEAKVTVYPNEQVRELLTAVDADIPQLLIISPDYFEIASAGEVAPADAVDFEDVAILVEKADGEVCDRCRQIRKDVGVDEKLPHLCGRCAKIVEENYPEAVAEGFE
ncbi:Isoleucine--tRNA ligase [bioreactor metagenome]|uniref:Isoleucine--tRNA ligase n=1 Tax=bioreactor metagenome TaxID=1076179 RepID=A0A645FQJ8_9ZZZZ